MYNLSATELKEMLSENTIVFRRFYAHVWESHYVYTDCQYVDRYSRWAMYCTVETWDDSEACKLGATITE